MPHDSPLFLVRHGEAAYTSPDGERELTAAGRVGAARLAAWCAAAGVVPHEIRHSGIRRAAQTAEILAARLAPPGGVRAVRGLAPDDDPQSVADELRLEDRPLMLVTHMPLVGDLAALLVSGNVARSVAPFAPGTLVRLDRTPDGGFRLAATWTP